MMAAFCGILILSPLIKQKKKNKKKNIRVMLDPFNKRVGPPLTKLSGSLHENSGCDSVVRWVLSSLP